MCDNAVLTLVVSFDPLVPLPAIEHHHPADGALAADSKDTADEKLEGRTARVHVGCNLLLVTSTRLLFYVLKNRCVLKL